MTSQQTDRPRPRVSLLRRAYRQAMRVQRKVLGALPVKWSSRIPARSVPFNGQQGRIAIVREIAQAFPIDRVVETGTFRGATTGLLRGMFGKPVISVEADPRFHAYSARRVGKVSKVELELGDSRTFLRRLSERIEWTEHPTFFYLDAHWEHDLPLADELKIIARSWERAVVMIDDFEVPGDRGYGFDDYGPSGALTEDLLPVDVAEWELLYPALPSGQETGSRRGCCVLISPKMRGPELSTLRRAQAAS